jgi:Uma2 family endonuclease
MSTTTKLVTAEELAAMGDVPYELIRGVLVEVSPTRFRHWSVSGQFAKHLVLHSATSTPGEVLVGEGGIFLEHDPDTVLAPDVAFMRAERVPPKEEQDQFSLVMPDVVVEVLSSTTTRDEIERKVGIYLGAGIPLVWVADTRHETIKASFGDGRMRIYRVGEDLDGGDVLPGFHVPVAEFFS